jgi:hypothetical protein
MAAFTVPNRRTGHSRLQPADVWRVDKRPPHAVPENDLALELHPQDGRTTGAAHLTPPVSIAVFSRLGKDDAITQTKNASRLVASRRTILMVAISVATTEAFGLPVVLVASHDLAAQSSSTRPQQNQTMGAVITKDGQAGHCPGLRSG